MTTPLIIERLEVMSQGEEITFWAAFETLLSNDDGAAEKRHFAAGHPIYYCDDRFPDAMVRKWPDGRRELINVDSASEDFVIKIL